MKFLSDMLIGRRLGIAFAISIAFSLLLAGYARHALVNINDELELMVEDRMVKVSDLEQVKHNLATIGQAARNIVLIPDQSAKKQELAVIDAARTSNGQLLQKLDKSIASARGDGLLAAATAIRAPYNAAVQRVIELGMSDQTDEARDIMVGETQKLQQQYSAALDELIAFQKELMRGSAKATDQMVDFAAAAVVIAAVAALAIGAALAWLITRSVVTPIQQAVRAAETVALGDLRLNLTTTRKDEAGQLLAALQRMNDALVGIVSTVRGNADSVATASGQIAQGNADLSQRTEEQASNLQQTAASMEQLSATINHNNDTASQAAQLAGSAARVATSGGQVVGQVVDTMVQITESSEKIADIIGTIDGIAFQTNILALNAAVEAARAGEQGRGFAVVAGEVRALAQRSAQAAREIKVLIGASVERVHAGNTLAADAGRTMGEVVSQVQRVADLISEISAASSEQSKGVTQIGDAVSQLDQVTQQNAALVEESAAAAESLRIQASQLAETVAAFKLDEVLACKPETPTTRTRSAVAHRTSTGRPRAVPALAATPTTTPAASTAGDEWTSF